MNNIQQALQLLSGANPDQIMKMMMNNNPKFKEFVDENKSRSPQEIAEKYGLDYNTLKNIIG